MPRITRRNAVLGGSCLICLHALRAVSDESLPPSSSFFRDADRRHLRLSPNGQTLAWIEPCNRVPNIIAAPLADLGHPRQLTFAADRPISAFAWAFTNKHIVFFVDDPERDGGRPFCVDVQTLEARPLLPDSRGTAFIQHRDRNFPSKMLFGRNDRKPELFDIVRIDLITGETSSIFENPGFVELVTDSDFAVRFGRRYAADGAAEIVVRGSGGDWSTFAEIPAEDVMTTTLEGISHDGASAFMLDSRGQNTAALVEIDLATREHRILAQDPEADITGTLRDPASNRPWAATSFRARRCWHLIDPDFAADLVRLRQTPSADDFVVADVAEPGGRIVTVQSLSTDPDTFRLYERSTGIGRPLFGSRDGDAGKGSRPMQSVTIKASDGVLLPGYLTLPADDCRTGSLVLLVHGGPYLRDKWGYSAYHQWLASRGYATLSVNYRGSTGYGKAFVTMADQGWGGRMQDDLTDAVHWAVAQNHAEPGRLGFFGESYGGYAGLVAATRTPELFACIVEAFGPSDLVTWLGTLPAAWTPWLADWKRRLADPSTPEGREWLRAHSPVNWAKSVSRPLLIAQGLKDIRVPPSQSQTFVTDLSGHGKPVTYITFPDEGHGFKRSVNRMAFIAVVESFFAQHLGGRAEPSGDALSRSTIRFEAGREHINGLG